MAGAAIAVATGVASDEASEKGGEAALIKIATKSPGAWAGCKGVWNPFNARECFSPARGNVPRGMGRVLPDVPTV